MALFEWNDLFSVKVPSIDEQHKELINYINKLHEAMLEGKAKNEIAPILTGLIDYTKMHFAHEEELFSKYNYYETQEHTEIHRNLEQQVIDFKARFDSGEANLSTDLMEFLKDWLMNHIMDEDKKYEDCLTSQNAQ
jgi:hemerythrin-like metal-binding protein